ncbi:MAG TPA: adenylate/guanylate cyclase domain-containing protein [Usitatibacter sp.]|jgi:class 3 adenylate cyclase|nr:adenylate/guanylate cyclase domain-containing protein [Usitatibacter sp.]
MDRRTFIGALRSCWERLRLSPRWKAFVLLPLVALVVAIAALVPSPEDSALAGLERAAFDAQMRILRAAHPRPMANDVVLVGIDELSERAFPEPMALWHVHFAEVLHALARAKPAAVGVDIALPERSYEFITRGLDIEMMRGLLDLKRAAVLVYVQNVDSQRAVVPVQANYRGVLGAENFGLDRHVRDADSVSRRFQKLTYDDGSAAPTLVTRILAGMGRPAGEGFIDYSLGAPVEYVAFHRLRGLRDDELRERFAGKVVLVGSLVGSLDRWRLPVKLLAHDPGRAAGGGALEYEQPGVLIHLQALRSLLGPGLLKPLPEWLVVVLCGAAALLGYASANVRPAFVLLGAALLPAALFTASLFLIPGAQLLLPVASIVFSFWTALVVRGVFDAVEAVVERVRLQQSFAGQVSPAVMKEMLGGGLTPGVSGQLADVCVLFSDVRDFTTLSENMPPHVVTTVLQRYFDRMVHAVHRYDGTVDKFIGDGMMVLFGAPRRSKDPCGDAVQCALGMMMALDSLNREFEREGLPTLTIGIGINYGTVTVGNIGSSERHNYSAIGDAVNVAARVEGLTKELGRKIIITEPVVSRIEERFHFDPLGTHKLKGHSPVKVWGIRTSRAAPSLADTMEVVRT